MRSRIVLAGIVCSALAFGAGTVASGQPASTPKPPAAKPKPPAAKPKLQQRVLFAVMTGRNEVDADGRRGAGDLNGRGSFTAIVDGSQLCFGITVKDLGAAPTAAHIHGPARRNQNADVVVPLTPPSAPDPGASSGCVSVDPAAAQAILKHPHKYYVNVHTSQFPAGAVRGQLSRKSN
jgi:CHRD domain